MEHKPVQSTHSISPSTDNRRNETDLYTFSPMLLCSSFVYVVHSFRCCPSLFPFSTTLRCPALHYTGLRCTVLYCTQLSHQGMNLPPTLRTEQDTPQIDTRLRRLYFHPIQTIPRTARVQSSKSFGATAHPSRSSSHSSLVSSSSHGAHH